MIRLTIFDHAYLVHAHWLAFCIYMIVRYVKRDMHEKKPTGSSSVREVASHLKCIGSSTKRNYEYLHAREVC